KHPNKKPPMKPEAVVTPSQMGVPFGRRSPHVRGPYSMPKHMLDTLPNGNIRINGDDHLYCSRDASPQSSNASVPDLIEQWTGLNENCRGGSGDDPQTLKQCDKRDEVSESLEALGYCYQGESNAASEWARCE
ncbi:hypothetical protein LQK81_16540, partial [Rhizobium sp. GN54]|nr:hypothetical protein [Rhizobium sp. GN54]